jgi:hypothetical protein
MTPSIFSYIKTEESRYQTEEIRLGDNWNWNMRNHTQLIFHLKNGVFYKGVNSYDFFRAFKNIMEPVLNLAYWMEDIEVKDVVFYIENSNGRVLSFFIKKYHDEVYVKEHDIDQMFDELTESDIDYGGALIQKSKERPKIVPLNSIAFCDQTDIMGGAMGFKMNFNPDKLRGMSKNGWGNPKNGATVSIEELITLADFDKDPDGMQDTKKNQSTSKNIEVYIVRGNLPEHYLLDNDNMEKYYNQVQIVAFYTDKDHKQHGVFLYRKKEEEGNIKFHTTKEVHGRALGRGFGEVLVHDQVWTNFLTIHKTSLLEAASKVPLVTDDSNYSNKNKIQDMENLEITTIEEGKTIRQVPTAAPANLQLISNSINEWYEHSQLAGSAFDPVLGKEAVSGTTFRGQERTVHQGRGLHDRKRGQRAKFIEQIYRDWIIPDIVKEILKGRKFLSTLTSDEMAWVSEQLAENHANREQMNDLFEAKIPRNKDLLKQKYLEEFGKKGNKQLLEILKEEFDDIEVKMGINVAAKQKDLAGLSDKILSIMQYIFANPQGFQQAMQIPSLAKSFNDILEYSGLNPVDFSTITTAQPAQLPTQPQAQTVIEPTV